MERMEVVRVRLVDTTEYKPEKSRDGGAYAFWREYTKSGDLWKVSHGTSSIFDFCPVCGTFGDHREGRGYRCGEFQTVSTAELEAEITRWEAPGHAIRFFETLEEPDGLEKE